MQNIFTLINAAFIAPKVLQVFERLTVQELQRSHRPQRARTERFHIISSTGIKMGSNRSAVEGMDVFMEIWLITVCISFINSIKSCWSGCSYTVNASPAPLRSRTGVLGGRCSEDRLEVRVSSHLDRLDLFRNKAAFPDWEPNRADVACCHGNGGQGVRSPDDLGSGVKDIPGEDTCAATIPRQ